jgi:hypothetical protein
MPKNAVPAHRLTSGGYNFQTVDYPYSGTYHYYNEITGINNNGVIIGNYSGSPGYYASWTSYVAQPPYASSSSSFNSVTYPDATSTYMYAISDDTKIKVGYVLGPNFQGQHTRWGAVDYRGLWSLVNRHGDENDCKTTGNSHPPIHELLGFDNPSPHEVAVGFYTSAHYDCSPRPFEVKPGDNQDDNTPFNNIPKYWTNVKATGIDSVDDIVGTTMFKSTTSYPRTPPPAGWFQPIGSKLAPVAYWCCGQSGVKNPTAFNGIVKTTGSTQYVIVGSYTVGSKTHGFIFKLSSTTGRGVWRTIDALQQNYTVVNGINTDLSICGWYQDQAGFQEGFVGTVAPRSRERH